MELGMCFLVGTRPGDIDLLTLEALKIIQSADRLTLKAFENNSIR